MMKRAPFSSGIVHALLFWGAVMAAALTAGHALAGDVEARLAELGLHLPEAPPAAATYTPYRIVGDLVYIAGQGPVEKGEIACRGKVGRDLDTGEAYHCARLTGLVILAQLKAACGGDLDRVVQAVKIGGFVNAAPDFTDHPAVINGASDLLVDVFGEAGLAARYAVGVSSLPFNIPVEIDAVFQISQEASDE